MALRFDVRTSLLAVAAGVCVVLPVIAWQVTTDESAATQPAPTTTTTVLDVHQDFATGIDGWYVYDYDGGADGARNVFYPATWEPDGWIWADDSRWRIDTPETPDSVLALLRYEEWTVDGDGMIATSQDDPVDLTDATVSFEVNTDVLDMRGGHLTFWVLSGYGRWHRTQPLATGDGWMSNTFTLSLGGWHNSWHQHQPITDNPPPELGQIVSYGIAIVGFDGEPVGRLGLRDFRISGGDAG